MLVKIFAHYFYEQNNEDVEITLKIKGNFNISDNFISQIETIMEKENKFFYYDSYYGIEFDLSKNDIYQLSDITINEMEFIRTIYNLLDYYNVYDESNIPIDLMKLDYITIDMEF